VAGAPGPYKVHRDFVRFGSCENFIRFETPPGCPGDRSLGPSSGGSSGPRMADKDPCAYLLTTIAGAWRTAAVPVRLRPPLVGRGRAARGRPPVVLVGDATASAVPGVRGPVAAVLRARGPLARRGVVRGAPDGGRRLDATRTCDARPDRPLAPA